MRIAIVHDYFIQMGGAEKVAEELHAMFPGSDLVTTVDIYNTPGTVTSWMRYLPITKGNHRLFFLLYPFAVESLDLRRYDVIISSSSGYAKGVRKRADAVHICYCHTPMRWVWRYDAYAERESFGGIAKAFLPGLLWALKRWDLAAAGRPDHYIANSEVVAERIRRFYGRDSTVIPPPIDVDRFNIEEPPGDFYLVLSRLAPYKRLDLAVEACKALGKRLVVIGDGPARADLERIAGSKTEFLGRVSDELTTKYAASCKALIFPGEEDFGMTPLEINAAGRPVIALKAGGATETVIDGKTGVFFDGQSVESLTDAIHRFEGISWDQQILRGHARAFGTDVFTSAISGFVDSVLSVSSSATPVSTLAPLTSAPKVQV
jgi:glycosyltransferase involved in cell wall biosynthesis